MRIQDRARDVQGRLLPTHGMKGSPTWKTWQAMIYRCENPKATGYDRYGGRGIRVCARWRDSFVDFLADMGERPPGTSLDRIDNEGHYEPGNCRWADERVQKRNRGSYNRYLEAFGRKQVLIAWAEEIGVSDAVLRHRLKRMSVERALTMPKGANSKEFRKAVPGFPTKKQGKETN